MTTILMRMGLLVVFSACLGARLHGDATLLHEFTGGPSDGAYSRNGLMLDGTRLYGTTKHEDNDDNGTVFRMNLDGSAYRLLHSFARHDSEAGAYPSGTFVAAEDGFPTVLYGMTESGGASYRGTVFRINSDGRDFTLLHEFQGGPGDGGSPLGGLTRVGSTLYGMTKVGGRDDLGTVFRMNIDGSDFALLHEFAGGESDGAFPWGSLTLSGSTLFGMTREGGHQNQGSIFQVNTDGSGYALLHKFSGGDEGRNPVGSLTLGSSTLYGVTQQIIGDGEPSTVFRIETDGTGYEVLHRFEPVSADEPGINGDLTILEDTLFGTTFEGGASGLGNVYRIESDGSGYRSLYDFTGDGAHPQASLLLAGNRLIGTTVYGGGAGRGVVFSVPVPEPTSTTLLACAISLAFGRLFCRPRNVN